MHISNHLQICLSDKKDKNKNTYHIGRIKFPGNIDCSQGVAFLVFLSEACEEELQIALIDKENTTFSQFTKQKGRLKIRLDEFEVTRLDIVFDPDRYAACRAVHGELVQYRVAVLTRGGSTVNEVKVEVIDVDPPPDHWYADLPLRLPPKDSSQYTTVTLDPNAERFVDVMDGLHG